MMLRHICAISVIIVISLFASFFHTSRPVQATEDTSTTALEIIAMVNQHRISLGVHPLALNPTLSKMALDQVLYLQSQNFHPPDYDYHRDVNGEYPRQRALRYKWPTFGPDKRQIEIGENAGVGDLQFIFDYWRKSPLHKTAMENPAYREIGVGVVPHKFGFFIILVFGSRPNVFPTLFDPERCELFTANEYHSSNTGPWIRSIQTMQLKTASGSPITEPIEWRPKLIIPANTGYNFSLVLAGDNQETTTEVDLLTAHNTAIIPTTLPMLESGEITTRCVSDAPVVVAVPPVVTEASTLAPTEAPIIATTPVPTEAPVVAAATTPAPPTAQANIPPTATPEVKVETVNNASNLNPSTAEVVGLANVGRGSNLQCRQYPSSIAFSLGLIPSGSTLTILGLPGARDERIGFPDGLMIEIPDYAAARLGEGIELNELWLHVQWQMPEGTFLKCWVNAFYVSASYQDKSLISVASYLELIQRGKLDFIPYNVPGGPFN